MPGDLRDEYRDLVRSTKELLRWEQALGSDALPFAPEETPEPGQRVRPTHVNRHAILKQLAEEAAVCTHCELARGRTNSVFARGNPDTDLVFVGEGPGYHEDQKGLPFVGRAGQLLDKMIAAMGYKPDGVYICNVVKCRPPENRTPLPTEAIACSRFLRPQLEVIAPKAIVALGKCAAENLGVVPPQGRWRGTWGQWDEIPVMPTYHPAFLLRSPQFKRVVWEDLQSVLKKLGRPVSSGRKSG